MRPHRLCLISVLAGLACGCAFPYRAPAGVTEENGALITMHTMKPLRGAQLEMVFRVFDRICGDYESLGTVNMRAGNDQQILAPTRRFLTVQAAWLHNQVQCVAHLTFRPEPRKEYAVIFDRSDDEKKCVLGLTEVTGESDGEVQLAKVKTYPECTMAGGSTSPWGETRQH